MFEYFPGNYVWSMAVTGALNNGGLIDEVDRACRPIKDAAQRGEDAGTEDFLRAWSDLTDQLIGQADEAEKRGHVRTAGQVLFRACGYLAMAERMLSKSSPSRVPTYQRMLKLHERTFGLYSPRVSRVEIPYEGTTLPAYFSAAPATDDGPAPVIVLVNGLDSCKEHMYMSNHWSELAERGISCLMLDQPGTGESLRLQDLKARIDAEVWAGAAVDWLERRPEVDTARIGIVGWSLGGYYAPRSAAFEKRFALCVAWGANHNWGAVQRRRLEREGERPVPHYWEHVMWVWGQNDLDSFIEFADGVNLEGVVEQITVPFLITHGEGDRQIPLEYAHRSFDQAVNSPKRELRIFTAQEGGTEHIGVDHMPYVSVFIADWVADTFAEIATAARA
ncbi:S9 family peptidase [Mycolicibacterium sp. CBMA 226]|uniref:alpha/beta hydrolase family protein n=1 Tax=Mycolicibacterium sp. CBMA 226 TaxID=2606611 RepID=UPI0012DC4008|nr:alpha/beta fold hydrolase [Mycolicibacterium sp. CBMA 226]MUL79006.1 alpha/beta fold hydrolase [Mycolicibacterium sp. CBMA 226]QGW61322.1 2,6-dihydropseudooxynicotine hydrolase [Mycolicibacterium sp.]